MYSFSQKRFEAHNGSDNQPKGWHAAHQGVSVHTGFPNPAIDTRLDGLDLNQLLIKNSVSTYMMRIRGHDWRHVGIFDGDIAIIDRALSAGTNDIVIWWLDGDFAISARNRMRPDGIVWGVVTSVIHQYRFKTDHVTDAEGSGNA